MSNELIDDLENSGVIPAIEIGLPTHGVFYEDDVLKPGVDPMSIRVRPLSIVDEQNLKDPFLLSTGKALPKMIERACPQIAHPAELSEIDVEAILIAIRINTIGPDMMIKHTCQNPDLIKNLNDVVEDDDIETGVFKCREENQINVNLEEFIMRYGPFDDKMFELFDIGLSEQLGQKVTLRPMPYESSVQIMMDAIKSQSNFEKFANVTENEMAFDEQLVTAYTNLVSDANKTNIKALADSIHHVTSRKGTIVTDRDMIEGWLLELPLTEVQTIRERIQEIMEIIKDLSKLEYQCPKCGHQNTIYVQLDPQKLFTQAEPSETPVKSSAQSGSSGKKGNRSSRISQR